MEPQLTLFVTGADTGSSPPRRRRRVGRAERMAQRIDDLASRAEREAEECRLAGDAVGERKAREQARDARRSAQILRAGPGGVAVLMAA